MADENEKSVSIFVWVLVSFLILIPIIGWIFIVIFAIWGGNRTFKNYFRAMIVMWLLLAALIFSLPAITGVQQKWWSQVRQHVTNALEQAKEMRE